MTSVHAQDIVAEEPGADARFRLGPLRFTPSLVVSDVGVDNNVFNEETDPKQDTTAAIGPGVNWWLRAGRARFSGGEFAQYLYFHEYADQRGWNTGHRLRLETPLGRLTPFVEGNLANTRARNGYEIAARARSENSSARIGSTWRISGRTSLAFSAQRSWIEFADDQTFLGQSLAESLNRTNSTESLGLRYALTPLTTFVVAADASQDRFDGNEIRNSDSIRVMPGIEMKPFALIAGSASVGFQHFKVLSGATPDFNGLVAAASLRYVIRSFQLAGQVARDIAYSFDAETPYYTVNDYGLSLTKRLGRHWDAQVTGGWQRLDYRQQQNPGSSPLSADELRLNGREYGGGVGYQIGQTMRIGVNATQVSRTSFETSRSYNGLRIGASVSYGVTQQ